MFWQAVQRSGKNKVLWKELLPLRVEESVGLPYGAVCYTHNIPNFCKMAQSHTHTQLQKATHTYIHTSPVLVQAISLSAPQSGGLMQHTMKSRTQFCSLYTTHLSANVPWKETSLIDSLHRHTGSVSMVYIDVFKNITGGKGCVWGGKSKLWSIVGRGAGLWSESHGQGSGNNKNTVSSNTRPCLLRHGTSLSSFKLVSTFKEQGNSVLPFN